MSGITVEVSQTGSVRGDGLTGELESLLLSGHLARREHRLQDAKQSFAEAVDVARRANDRLLLAPALAGLGQIEHDLREIAPALLRYREAAAIYRALEQPLRLAHTVRHIGDILRQSADTVPAGDCYREALEIYREDAETLPLDLANAVRGYALLQSENGQSKEALALWREAQELYSVTNVQPGVDESQRQIDRLSLVA